MQKRRVAAVSTSVLPASTGFRFLLLYRIPEAHHCKCTNNAHGIYCDQSTRGITTQAFQIRNDDFFHVRAEHLASHDAVLVSVNMHFIRDVIVPVFHKQRSVVQNKRFQNFPASRTATENNFLFTLVSYT